MSIQPKLLRALQEMEIHPVGAEKPVKIDVRVLAATNVNLEDAVNKGDFRSDLFFSSEWMEIDPKLKPRPEEPVIHKKYASNFFGTHLAQTLVKLGVDTVIVMGATACACVRHTVMDSTGYGFKTIVPEGTIGDRVPGVVEWNLFDMDAKFADVLPVDEVVKYLEGIDASVYNK